VAIIGLDHFSRNAGKYALPFGQSCRTSYPSTVGWGAESHKRITGLSLKRPQSHIGLMATPAVRRRPYVSLSAEELSARQNSIPVQLLPGVAHAFDDDRRGPSGPLLA
jgi:hypothetical protein